MRFVRSGLRIARDQKGRVVAIRWQSSGDRNVVFGLGFVDP
jgi:hypothetical protein